MHRCVACGRTPVDKAHIKSRGSGGGNEYWNLMNLCRTHHQMQHREGWYSFSKKYPAVREMLTTYGWEFNSWRKLIRS